MNPVAKALWYVESHFADDVSLDEIAAVAGVSRFHLSRTFGMMTGHSVMGYVRGRRLTEAAKALASGAPDILAVALDAGYGSHEAFTRAFRDQFGITPEAVRAQGHLDNVPLVEAIGMDTPSSPKLETPRILDYKPLLIAGISESLNCGNGNAIPALWQRFGPHIGNIPGQVGHAAYGVTFNSDDAGNMDYLCGVEVADFSRVSAELSRLRIPEHRYAVFLHRGHISGIRGTWAAIMNEWLPESELRAVDAPFFERYDEQFDPRTGNGSVEIWVPIRS